MLLNKFAATALLSLPLGLSLYLPAAPSLAKPSAALAPAEKQLKNLRKLLREASQARSYTPATQAELQQVSELFLRLCKEAHPANLQKDAQRLQMEILELGDWRILQEQAQAQRGRGFYVFRASGMQHILQVPHSFKDEITREIGLALFAEGPFAAVAFNTVPRDFVDLEGREINADMAHLENTYFLAFAKTAARALPNGKTLQIHGFNQAKRKTAVQAQADIILSAGHKQAPASLQTSQHKLAANLHTKVNLYADNLRELGATTNVQAQALRAQGYLHFIHVELSRPMREQLREDKEARQQLLQNILGTV